MDTKIATATANERGVAMIGLIVAMVILAVLGAAMVSLTSSATHGHLVANVHNRAFYLAESGGRYGVTVLSGDLNANPDGVYELTNGDKFQITSNRAQFPMRLEVIGIVNEGTALEASVPRAYDLPVTNLNVFQYGVFAGGDGGITLQGSSYVDSYDSTISSRAWTTEGQFQNGGIGTNSVADSAIDLGSNTDIYGSVAVGPGGDPANVVSGVSQVSGGATALPASEDMTPMAPPSGVTWTNMGTLNLKGNSSKTLTAGHYSVLGDFNFAGSGTLRIEGDVVIKVGGEFEASKITGTAQILLAEGASLRLFVENDISLTGNLAINPGGQPADVQIFGSANTENISLNTAQDQYAVFHAPDAEVDLGGGGAVFGSVVADTVTLHGNTAIHYDESLARTAIGNTQQPALAALRLRRMSVAP